jgi:tRNA dimethylallyltransferase
LTGASGVPETDVPLRIVAGPTGAGKSALAMALARRFGAGIISADSRQIYRGFDIGTAKPSHADRRAVPHDGLDVAEPTERWNAARWALEADVWLADNAAAGRPSIIVGGTGLWLRALVRPLADEPPMDPVRRAATQDVLNAMDTDALRSMVENLDPARAHLGRAQLLRAAEVAMVSGERLSDWHAKGSSRPPREARWLIVDPGPSLADRLDARRAQMLADGWLAEVESLMARVPSDAPAWNACGYREIREAVEGRRTLDDALEAVRISTRQYAKRQRTWFRTQMDDVGPVTRLDPTAPDAMAVAERWFSEESP